MRIHGTVRSAPRATSVTGLVRHPPSAIVQRTAPSIAATTALTHTATRARIVSVAARAQVTGCGLCLEGLKRYYIRMRVCEKHLHAPAVLVNGTISRFCQQCGKWQAVAEFEGSKK